MLEASVFCHPSFYHLNSNLLLLILYMRVSQILVVNPKCLNHLQQFVRAAAGEPFTIGGELDAGHCLGVACEGELEKVVGLEVGAGFGRCCAPSSTAIHDLI